MISPSLRILAPVAALLVAASPALALDRHGGYHDSFDTNSIATDRAPSVRIAYRDLDLSRPEGAQTLRHRVEMAVRNVCGPIDIQKLHQKMLIERCRRLSSADVAPRLASAIQVASTGSRGDGAIEVARR